MASWICDLCNLPFTTKRALKNHEKSNRHLQKAGKHILRAATCDICGRGFARGSDLLRHRKRLHRHLVQEARGPLSPRTHGAAQHSDPSLSPEVAPRPPPDQVPDHRRVHSQTDLGGADLSIITRFPMEQTNIPRSDDARTPRTVSPLEYTIPLDLGFLSEDLRSTCRPSSIHQQRASVGLQQKLWTALLKNDFNSMEVVLRTGAGLSFSELDIDQFDGQTPLVSPYLSSPLLYATLWRNANMVELLCSHGVDFPDTPKYEEEMGKLDIGDGLRFQWLVSLPTLRILSQYDRLHNICLWKWILSFSLVRAQDRYAKKASYDDDDEIFDVLRILIEHAPANEHFPENGSPWVMEALRDTILDGNYKLIEAILPLRLDILSFEEPIVYPALGDWAKVSLKRSLLELAALAVYRRGHAYGIRSDDWIRVLKLLLTSKNQLWTAKALEVSAVGLEPVWKELVRCSRWCTFFASDDTDENGGIGKHEPGCRCPNIETRDEIMGYREQLNDIFELIDKRLRALE